MEGQGDGMAEIFPLTQYPTLECMIGLMHFKIYFLYVLYVIIFPFHIHFTKEKLKRRKSQCTVFNDLF